MDLYPALGLLAVFVLIAVFAGWRDSRPATLNPRMIPWRIVMLVAGACALFMGVQVFNALGIVMPRGQGGMP